MIKNIRKSISKKILIFILIISLIWTGSMYWFIRQDIEENILWDINEISNVSASYVEISLLNYFSKNTENACDSLKSNIKKFCQGMIIDKIEVIAQLDEDSNLGYVLLECSKENLITHDWNEQEAYRELEIYEKDIIKGEASDTFELYDSKEYGKTIVNGHCFEYFFDTYNKNIKIMVAVMINNVNFQSSILFYSIKFILFTIISILVVCLIYYMLINKIVIKRIHIINDSMKNFVKDNKIKNTNVKLKGIDELSKMGETFNKMCTDINEYIQKVNKYKYLQQKQAIELEFASQIQKSLLPTDLYNNKFYTQGIMQPAKNIGGDFYYYKLINDRLYFSIGDVSGKGITASLFMANLMSIIKYSFKLYDKPSDILELINKEVCNNNLEKLFVTLFIGCVDFRKKILTYSNAGHNPPYLIKDKIYLLDKSHGTVVGLFDDNKYEDINIKISDKDCIFMYTDGVTESINTSNELFGNKRLFRVLQETNKDYISAVYDKINNFSKGAVQNDDITILAINLIQNNNIMLPAKSSSIQKLKKFIMNSDKLIDNLKKTLYLAVEEIFVNIYSYGYLTGKQGMVEITLAISRDYVKIKFIDDAIKFNPLDNINKPLNEEDDLKFGGLGRLIVSDIIDEMNYEYVNKKNVLTLKKFLN